MRMSDDVELGMRNLRQFMYDKVYRNPVAKCEEDKAVSLVKTLYEYYMRHTDALPKFLWNWDFRESRGKRWYVIILAL